jgi:pimeloyl-ACP methyl ester carboxylesterase
MARSSRCCSRPRIRGNAELDDSGVEWLAPSRVGDERFEQQLARFQRHSVRLGAWEHYYRQTLEADIADVLPSIRTPALVLNRTGKRIVPLEQSRVAAAAIEGARFVELPGTDHLPFSEGIDSLVMRSKSSSPAPARGPTRIECSRRCCSPTS